METITLENALKNISIIHGNGHISYHPSELIYIAVVHDGRSSPTGVIYIDKIGSEQTSLQKAFKNLEEHSSTQDRIKKVTQFLLKHDFESDEANYTAHEWVMETFNGFSWTMKVSEAKKIIESNSNVSKHVSINIDGE